MKFTIPNKIIQKVLRLLPWIIIFAGSVARIIVWFQNRNLFIDEANIARNIYERSLTDLARPLSYEQYAPPVFLWLTKICASLFGYSEMVLRLVPLLSGIGSLVMLFLLLRELVSNKAIWYPLALMAVSFIMIRYSSELKQYMTDAFVVLGLMTLALKTDILKISSKKFALVWLLAGSLAIWSSMPAVFALAGVGCYYFWIVIRGKAYQKMTPLLFVCVWWLLQFGGYFFLILKPQADTDYLQKYHSAFFVFLMPGSKEQIMHNWYLFKDMLRECSGYDTYSWIFNTVLFVLGAVLLLWKNTARGLLLLVPLVAVFLAAGLHQYSLIGRMTIFAMPVILSVVAYGFYKVISIRFWPSQLLITLFTCQVINHHSLLLPMIKEPYRFETITEEFDLLQQHHISGQQLYVHGSAVPAYIYYTEIHPGKARWRTLLGGHHVGWGTNLDSIGQTVQPPLAFIYSSLNSEELQRFKEAIGKYFTLDTFIEAEQRRCYVYIYNAHKN
ncbi:glycosyltransferase family 39 protein [Taibaiella soli]|uniref:Glycosyltransferase RgtA/B/C/D-like domain-containing protein n=1 Tax=Taibaiella soli TaxID=1649169 RepID=A0A2W2AJP3_9BACT|nr:glycosyltransferase family 39 protein [Taibaiella soli]PZF72450.1 hypothetical protein DN068_13955 [Taibaiella soli]